MVVLKVKGKNETDVFLVETTTKADVGDAITQVVEIWNLRLRLKWYTTNGLELGKECNCDQLKQTCEDANAYMSAEQAARRKFHDKAALEEHIRLIRGCGDWDLRCQEGRPFRISDAPCL